MRLYRLLFITGLSVFALVGTAQAAVYGTLQSETLLQTEGKEPVIKEKGDVVNIVSKEEGKYIVTLEDESTYEVEEEAVQILGSLTKATAEDTKVRVAASPEADIIDFLDAETVVLALERQDNFYKVKLEDREGYIYKSQIDETDLELLPYKKTVVEKPIEQKTYIGEEVVNYAKQFLGGRYVYGGNSLTTGVDCSGFTQQIMKKFGVSIARSSRAQYSTNGYRVSVDNILPGDLVFYGTNGKTIDHVAIYAGGGQIIHASDAKSGIKMSKLYYGKPMIGIKRVLD
ncbi:hypothetical protein CS063_07750 [Sporanaerobium hydrogeniformans]|uniref:Uncharacterized protein n=1 Tax=Sporanaerobium hydrogeniformans TaxID=3072179 RepID=A0AC61DEC5_9FIRM|nr:C40 family peptidase [Sporanaerobium hydrogeniformans]PHV70907.1 hypothetical protein CS063_07750 [Sporanaerobium hydrogeniformans]